jgi:hypothetical protein
MDTERLTAPCYAWLELAGLLSCFCPCVLVSYTTLARLIGKRVLTFSGSI